MRNHMSRVLSQAALSTWASLLLVLALWLVFGLISSAMSSASAQELSFGKPAPFSPEDIGRRPRVTVAPDDFQIDFGGEFDAVVIRPGLKQECPEGRVLASSDIQIRSGVLSSGIAGGTGDSVVVGRDFDGANRIVARFDK